MGEPCSEELDDQAVLLAYWQKRKPLEDPAILMQSFLPVHLHRVVTIGLAMWDNETQAFKLWSIACNDDANAMEGEAFLLQRFYDGINKHTPQLVSWNGSGFDLPVLHHRALIHGVMAGRYWELGDHRQDFRYNNYISRYHYRHLDLMDVLSAYNGKNFAKLDDMAKLCGLPGKHGMDGSQVSGAFAEGRILDIRRYCEADVLNTTLLYFRYLKMTERLSSHAWQSAEMAVRQWLEQQTDGFWRELQTSWH